jgi:hypothetical protein
LKRNTLYLGLLCFLIVGCYVAIPATSLFAIPATNPCGWAELTDTVTDAVDDVVRYELTGNPAGGTEGDYHDEIDIVNVSAVYAPRGSPGDIDLLIWFADLPGEGEDYTYVLYIDNDTDGQTDYLIFSNYTYLPVIAKAYVWVFYLQRVSDGKYWDDGVWYDEGGYNHLNTVITSSKRLYIYNVGRADAIANLYNSHIGMIAAYTGDPEYIYADYLPIAPQDDNIPGFPWQAILLGIMSLLGISILLRKNDIHV